jgi:hypothetical protein
MADRIFPHQRRLLPHGSRLFPVLGRFVPLGRRLVAVGKRRKIAGKSCKIKGSLSKLPPLFRNNSIFRTPGLLRQLAGKSPLPPWFTIAQAAPRASTYGTGGALGQAGTWPEDSPVPLPPAFSHQGRGVHGKTPTRNGKPPTAISPGKRFFCPPSPQPSPPPGERES